MPTVDICAHTVPPARSRPSMTSCTASPLASMVTTTSASRTASAGASQTSMPAPASGSAFSRERFQARTSCPAAAMLRAMGAPMIPVPRTATRISGFLRTPWGRALVAQDGADAAKRPEVVVMADAYDLGRLLDGLLDGALGDVLHVLGGARGGAVLRRGEHAGPRVLPAVGGEPRGDQQDLHARLVERRQHVGEPGDAALTAAHALGQAIQRLALVAAHVLGDALAGAGADIVQGRVLHVALDAAGQPLAQVGVQASLEVADQLVGAADQQPVEPLALVQPEGDLGRMDEVVVLLLVHAPLVARLRPAALLVLAVDVILD